MAATADVAIVGFGIAGATLAHSLIEQCARVVVFDSPARPAVSRSAGSIASVAGLRFGVIEQWQQWWDAALSVYTEFGVMEPIACYRLVYRADEQNFWERKRHALIAEGHARPAHLPQQLTEAIEPPLETIEIVRAAKVHAASLLDRLAAQLDRDGRYVRRTLSACDVEPVGQGYRVAGVECKHVVFCEGAWMADNRWFGWIPRMFARGQRIVGVLDRTLTEQPVWLSVAGKSLVVVGDRFTFGSTYDWHSLEPIVTDEATAYLSEQLARILRCGHRVTDAWTGVRPIVADLRPVVGEHPHNRGMWIFNGLGSRGLLLAPRLAQLLARCIAGEPVSLGQWDVARFAELLHAKP